MLAFPSRDGGSFDVPQSLRLALLAALLSAGGWLLIGVVRSGARTDQPGGTRSRAASLVAIGLVAGCGGDDGSSAGSSAAPPLTPAGTYNVVVTATSPSTRMTS